MLTIGEQESFMHRIYDVIHNGIGMSNLILVLQDLQSRFGNLNTILNTNMKNEKYSSSFDLPIMKVIFESQTLIMSVSHEEFTQRKLEAIKILQKYGCHLNILNEKYKDKDIDWNVYVEYGLVPQEVYDLIKEYVKDDKITIKI